jgi:hypothetical protein
MLILLLQPESIQSIKHSSEPTHRAGLVGRSYQLPYRRSTAREILVILKIQPKVTENHLAGDWNNPLR